MSDVKRRPLHRGFLIRILCETNPFLKSVRWKEVSVIEDVRYREVLLHTGSHGKWLCSDSDHELLCMFMVDGVWRLLPIYVEECGKNVVSSLSLKYQYCGTPTKISLPGTSERFSIWYGYWIETMVFIVLWTIYELFWIECEKFWSGHGTSSNGLAVHRC